MGPTPMSAPATCTAKVHHALAVAIDEIGQDRDNRVLVLTGSGDRFMADFDGSGLAALTKPATWDLAISEGRRIMQRLVDPEMPIVAAVNGPAAVHSEYTLLADIIIAANTTVFSDFPHLTHGIVPGDGVFLPGSAGRWKVSPTSTAPANSADPTAVWIKLASCFATSSGRMPGQPGTHSRQECGR